MINIIKIERNFNKKGWYTLEGLNTSTSLDKLKALEVGCGMSPTKIEGVDILHVDKIKHSPHIAMELDASEPFPFEDETFDIVLMFGTLEHIIDIYPCVEEIYRVLKKGGLFIVSLPHYSNSLYYREMQHIHAGSSRSFDSFTKDSDISMGKTTKAKFELLDFSFSMKLGKLFHKIVKRYIRAYEDWQLCFKLFPIYDMFFKLKKV